MIIFAIIGFIALAVVIVAGAIWLATHIKLSNVDSLTNTQPKPTEETK